MIDIRELRIGNLVYLPSLSKAAYGDTNVPFCVEEIFTEEEKYKVLCHCDTKEGYNCTEDAFLEEIEPILLTEELRLKLGFSQMSNTDSDGIIKLSIVCDDDILYLTLNWNNYQIFKDPIKYLHQLQNIYFDLTGKELEVSL